MNDLTGKYFVKNTENGDYTDFATLFDGLRILKIDGFTAKGQAKNVYTASWEYDEEEDFTIVMQDDEDPVKIIRECTDLDITFIIKGSYATNTIDAQRQHLAFVDYMTNTDVWVKSAYQNNLEVHCVCLKEYKPTTEKYQRGTNSYVMGTISMHMMEEPATVYLVNYTLNGVTTQYKAYGNETFVLPLLPDSGKQIIPASVTVTMGGTNVTNNSYNYELNQIVIPNATGNINITAESGTIPDTYKALLYVQRRSSANTTALETNYKPNYLTKLEMDVKIISYTAASPLFCANYTSSPNYALFIQQTTQDRTVWFRNSDTKYMTGNDRIAINTRMKVVADKSKITYTTRNGNRYSTTAGNDTTSWTSAIVVSLGGSSNQYAPSSYVEIYRTTISESNVVRDYIPCVRLSDSVFGLYDTVQGKFISRANTYWIGPTRNISSTLTSCTASLLSAAKTGTTTKAAIGETWSSKFTASENYTFNGGTFNVMVNGEEKTSQLATYDSTTDSWTVTLVAHWKDTIEITATAVAS